ncbi:MAG TPA: PRC-barrel domain-containing protein [Euzebyales bacterium]
MTLQFERARRTPVYTRDAADEIGHVIRYVIMPGAHHVAAVHVAGRKRRAQLVDWSSIVGFGPDAVVVDSADSLRPAAGDHEQRVVAGDLDLLGRRVLTDGGYEIGELADVDFDESSGVLELIRTTHTAVGGDGLLAIGPYAVIVRHDAVRKPREPAEE